MALSFGDYDTVSSIIENGDMESLAEIHLMIETRQEQIQIEERLTAKKEQYRSLRRCLEWSDGKRCLLDKWHTDSHSF